MMRSFWKPPPLLRNITLWVWLRTVNSFLTVLFPVSRAQLDYLTEIETEMVSAVHALVVSVFLLLSQILFVE